MAAAVQVVPLALLHMPPVQQCLYSLGLCQQGDLQAIVLITRRLCVALRWWKVPGNISRGSRLGPVLCRQVISVDASLKGWGALHEGRGTSRRLGVLSQGQHINALELRAIHLALRHFISCRGCRAAMFLEEPTAPQLFLSWCAINKISAVTCLVPAGAPGGWEVTIDPERCGGSHQGLSCG